jgi:hypothetical protein
LLQLEELREENDALRCDRGTIERLQAKVKELEGKLSKTVRRMYTSAGFVQSGITDPAFFPSFCAGG